MEYYDKKKYYVKRCDLILAPSYHFPSQHHIHWYSHCRLIWIPTTQPERTLLKILLVQHLEFLPRRKQRGWGRETNNNNNKTKTMLMNKYFSVKIATTWSRKELRFFCISWLLSSGHPCLSLLKMHCWRVGVWGNHLTFGSHMGIITYPKNIMWGEKIKTRGSTLWELNFLLHCL